MAGPGKDNITGDRYTLDLGVEPDLGNLLQNLSVANQLLDEAENKFKAISTVVGTTTQRVNELTRATQLFVTQTQRIRNEYEGIADASSRMGDLASVGASGMSLTPGMGLIGSGMSPSVTNQLIAQSMMGGRFGEPGDKEDAPQVQLESKRPETGAGKRFGNWVSGWLQALLPYTINNKGQASSAAKELKQTSPIADTGLLNYLKQGTRFGGPDFASMGTGALAKSAFGELAGGAGITTGMGPLASFNALAGRAVAPIATKLGLGAAGTALVSRFAGPIAIAMAAKQVADFAYGTAAQTALQAQQYTRLTGGTSVATSGYTPFQGLRGEELRATSMGGGPLGTLASFFGYTNPLFNREQANEAMGYALGAGYRQNSGRRQEVFDYLKTLTVQGYGDMAGNMDVYEEVVDKAGGSISALTSAIDRLKKVAQTTDASIQQFTKNFKKQIEILTGAGYGGTNAAALATDMVTAYSGAATPAVRNSAGPDIMSPYMRAGLAGYLGTSYGELPGVLTQGMVTVNGQQVATTTATAQYTDQKIAETLRGMGFTPGMTYQEVMGKVSFYSGALSQLGILPANINPNDYESVANFIMQYTGKEGANTWETPIADANAERLEGAKATSLDTNTSVSRAVSSALDNGKEGAKKGVGVGSVVGGVGGALAGAGYGASIGATIGSIALPGIGTAIGGIAGGLIGGAVGWFGGKAVGGAAGGAIGGIGGLVGGATGDLSTTQLDDAGVKYSSANGIINLEDRGEYDAKGREAGGGFFGLGGREAAGPQASSVEQWYEAQLNNQDLGGKWMDIGEGRMNMPIMNELLEMGDRDLRNTYVKLSDGRRVNLANALSGDTNMELSEADRQEIMAGLSGEQEMEYAVKDEEGNLTGWSTLSNISSDNEGREKDKEEKAKPDGSPSKPFHVVQSTKGWNILNPSTWTD